VFEVISVIQLDRLFGSYSNNCGQNGTFRQYGSPAIMYDLSEELEHLKPTKEC
jgi:hypothetical protein